MRTRADRPSCARSTPQTTAFCYLQNEPDVDFADVAPLRLGDPDGTLTALRLFLAAAAGGEVRRWGWG